MEQLPKTLPAFFLHFIKPYKMHILGLFITGLVWGAYNSLSPYVLKLIIDEIVTFSGDKSQIFPAIENLIIIYMALWAAIAVNMRFFDWIKLRLNPNIRRDMIASMFSYLNRHSHSYFQNNFAGSLANKISDMTGSVVSIMTKMDEAFAQIICLVVATITMFIVHPLFATILILWVIGFTLISLLFTKNIKVLANVFATSKTTLVGKTVDSVSNVVNMRLFSRNKFEDAQLKSAIDDTVEKDRDMQWYVMKMHIFWDISILLLIGFMLTALISMYSKGLVTIGDFAFIINISTTIFLNLWHMAGQFMQFSEEIGKCSQALTIITEPHEVVDSKDAKPLKVDKGRIEFENVTFQYKRNNNLFNEKNIVIPSGQKVGLVGFSGSGKTTFVNLILRLFDIHAGKIMIDGQSIRDITQDSLRENISMIPQDTSLFHRSLMENIRYGKLDATDEEIIEASKKAHCHDFAVKLSGGYNSTVGERGIKLSGGQRQRIAIARAMLKNAPILILDEATSALDSVTEKHIQDAMQTLMQGRTTIVIAHRLSTLSEMDRILVFDKGEVIEDGTHKQLLKKKNGHYKKMWEMQAGGFLPEKIGE
jgi:ATP-binding cassette subfamily B protein